MSAETTVVFTDLIGSTAVFEAMGNTRATEAVTQLTSWICGICVKHDGKVIKTLGDGVLAIFPNSQKAVDAVVLMQRMHQQRIVESSPELRMPIRIGVASGEVEIVGGDCFGDAVNVAARLSDLCGPHEIWANSQALSLAIENEGVRFRSVGSVQIRGRSEPCSAFQIEWHDDLSSAFLTRQADLESVMEDAPDVLGGEIKLSWLGHVRFCRAFDLPVRIGRISGMEVLVNDPRVSRSHARIDWRNGSIMLVDLSTYGSWVRFSGGGADLPLRRNECVLHGEGKIALGAPFADSSVPILEFSVT